MNWNDLEERLKEALALIKGKLRQVNDINEIRTHLTTTVGDLSEVLRLYEKKFDAHYEQSKPFSTNDKFLDSDEFAKIVRDAFSVSSYRIIKKWAIDYPSNNPQVLNQPLSFYAEQFQQDLEDWDKSFGQQWHPDSQEYWKYLAEGLTANVPEPATAVPR